MIMFGSFLPGLLVGWHHQSLLGSREPTLSWNQLHSLTWQPDRRTPAAGRNLRLCSKKRTLIRSIFIARASCSELVRGLDCERRASRCRTVRDYWEETGEDQ